jgi:CheY-like chemotaxis protein
MIRIENLEGKMPVKVLTVDDSKTIRMIVKKAFKPYDCKLFEAENGVEGLATAAKVSPDLIVLDITMPVMNGIEMLGKLKEEPALKDIPVIMLTAESGKDNVMQIVKMGVKDYMVKPFKGEQLIERATRLIQLKDKPKEVDAEEPAKKYFALDGDVMVLKLPGKINRPVIAEIDGQMGPTFTEMRTKGIMRFILDLTRTGEVNMSLIKLIIMVDGKCRAAKAKFRMVGSESHETELTGFQETSDIPVDNSIEKAKEKMA